MFSADIYELSTSINVHLYIDMALYFGYVKSLFTEIITMANELSFVPEKEGASLHYNDFKDLRDDEDIVINQE